MGLILNKSQCACKPLRFARIGIERGIQKTSFLSARSRACCLRFFAHAQQRCSVRVPSAVSPRCIFGRSMTELLGSEPVRLVIPPTNADDRAPEAHVELGGSSAPPRLGLLNPLLGLLPLGSLYRFRFAAGRAFRRAENPMTSDLEVVLPVRRARVAADGHGGTSFRVCAIMKSSRSESVNMRRWRFVPWPVST